MHRVLEDLVDLLALEPIEDNLFRGRSRDLGWGAIFGGQVLGQALSATAKTVPDDRIVHSLHGYFLRRGEPQRPVVYEVDRIRDGKSFTTRRVVAIQGGRAIFNMAASFQRSESGYEHATAMPPTVGPDALPSELTLARQKADKLPAAVQRIVTREGPFEFRPVNPYDLMAPEPRPPQQAVWFRAIDSLPDDPALHRYLLAYVSDFYLLGTAMWPHGISWLLPGMQIASLDHAMWFHRPFRIDEWLLYSLESPSASGGRGLVRGQMFTREGLLVAETVQEGVMRNRNQSDSGG